MTSKPTSKPQCPNFSSGPCAKRPGYSLANLTKQADRVLGRSHRAAIGKEVLGAVCQRTADILKLPPGYRVGCVPASDTGAVEMVMWSALGPRPVDVFSWESFGATWLNDIVAQLKLPNVRDFSAKAYGEIADLSQADSTHDIVFAWNGTTSGAKVPDGNWLKETRGDDDGLVICDATSAVFAMELPYEKLDVVTFSWQKVLGGEGAHGMLVLSPRAVQRLESYSPPWPLPKIFRMTSKGKLIEGIFKGDTINTPSMLCAIDYLDALDWVESIGGVAGTIRRSEDNLQVWEKFVAEKDWIEFLAQDKKVRSNTSVCFTLKGLSEAQLKQMVKLLGDEKVAFDIASYRDAPPGLRVWCGATVEKADLECLTQWFQWAYDEARK